ncbi:MAG: DUF2125 domain-containing protein [Pseudomonadota bacterium]
MSRMFTLAVTTGLAFAAVPAAADLSASDAWENYRSSTLGFGALTWSSIDESDTSLNIRSATWMLEEDDVSVTLNMGDLMFTELAGGLVSLSMGETMPLVVVVQDNSGPVTIIGNILLDAATTVFSGEPSDITQSYSVAALEVAIDEIDSMASDATIDAGLVFETLEGVTRLTDTGDGLSDVDFSLSAASTTYSLRAVDPTEGQLDVTVSIRETVASGQGMLPTGPSAAAPEDFLKNPAVGMSTEFGSAATAFSFSASGGDGAAAAEMLAGASQMAFALTDGSVSYAGTLEDIAVSVEAPDIPVPVNVGVKRYAYETDLPLLQTDEDRDFTLGLTLEDIAIDDFLWNLFDPGQVLPRDPATLSFLVSLQGRWLLDILSPDDQMIDGGVADMPVRVSSADISGLELSAAGAEVTGEGTFTFNNDDLFTFEGFPAPTGAMDFRILGANGLIDKLVGMGLVPPDQAMGARMMMGLFTIPGAGEDELTSRLEVRGNGQVFANGQRLR